MQLIAKCLGFVGFFILIQNSYAEGFVRLPASSELESAYVLCNPTGDMGTNQAIAPTDSKNNACAVTSQALIASPMNAPLEGFRMVGMLVRDASLPASYAGSSDVIGAATITDTFWRNQDKTQCILGTHVMMNDTPMTNGQYWEINDILRSGFASKDIEIAYFYAPRAENRNENPEMLFRAGRTYTSVKYLAGQKLPSIKNAPSKDKGLSEVNAAAVSENWVDFTTDINFKDPDGSSRKMSSMLYIKYNCDAKEPSEQEGAVRLRTTGQNGQPPLQISVSGLVPADAMVERY